MINLDNDYLKIKSRDYIYNQLLKAGIKTNLHYLPVHLHPFFENMGFNKGQFPIAENYAVSALSLPLYYSISDEELSYVNEVLHSVIT